ncbi:MAG: hypothetical protein GAK31_01694 [Stenotrophomonas maltophilia]|uniref:Uncharacterized protein n=1 Tax=Stenotrophomonas maltophilia TaxID=40324 RepID=A0A7V8FHZ8_STEMA|nr:MAG: hypothetical protein GAK31_01694 [Stenotrophomonas maltophilia]
MRDYAKVVPTFWTGATGKAIRRRGSEGVVVAMYLMSSPHSNMLGLFYQPMLYMAHETGLGLEGASKGFQVCIEEGFCHYDEASEMVWVVEMAKYQIGSSLKASDNRCAGIQREYNGLQDNPFLYPFWRHYQAEFHLTNARGGEAPSKPLASQEQEQEQDQEQETTSSLRSDSSPPLALTGGPASPPANLPERKAQRIRQIAEEARAAYNATLAKPHGLLPACTVLNKPRIKAVEKALPKVRQLCQRLFGNEKVTPQFWTLYFETAADDDFHAGRLPGGPGHENWTPDFEYLLRETVIAKLADRALSEAAA